MEERLGQLVSAAGNGNITQSTAEQSPISSVHLTRKIAPRAGISGVSCV